MPNPTYKSHISYTSGRQASVHVTGIERGSAPPNCEDRYLTVTAIQPGGSRDNLAFHTRQDFYAFVNSLSQSAIDIGWHVAPEPVEPQPVTAEALRAYGDASLDRANAAYDLANALDKADAAGVLA